MSRSSLPPLSELRVLTAAATPAPWRVDDSQPGDIVVWGPPDTDSLVANVGDGLETDAADAAFIAAAREAVPALCDEIERLRSCIARALEAAGAPGCCCHECRALREALDPTSEGA